MCRKIENGKVEISGVEITVKHVLQWMKETNHYVTSVEMRDHFGWPMRQTCRSLMKLLAKEGKVCIIQNPKRKRSWIYGLPKMPVPNETYEPYKPPKSDKQLQKGKFAPNNNKPKTAEKKKTKKSKKKVEKPKKHKTKKSEEKNLSTPKVEKVENPVISKKKLRVQNGIPKPIQQNTKVQNPWTMKKSSDPKIPE